MEHRLLGRPGFNVSVLSLGTGTFGALSDPFPVRRPQPTVICLRPLP